MVVVWHGASSTGACQPLGGAGFSIEMETSGKALADCYYVGPEGLWWSSILNSALPPQKLGPDTRPEYQDPVSYTAQKKREEKNNNNNNK